MKRYWFGFIAVIVVGFAVLGWAGYRIYQEKPPIPDLVVTNEGKTVIGRRLVIKCFGRVRDIETSCHVLFISSSETENLSRIMDRLKGSSVLTVGEMDGFTRRGGIIGFVVYNNKIGFEVNLGAAKRANLKISSKLLKLAKAIIN